MVTPVLNISILESEQQKRITVRMGREMGADTYLRLVVNTCFCVKKRNERDPLSSPVAVKLVMTLWTELLSFHTT